MSAVVLESPCWIVSRVDRRLSTLFAVRKSTTCFARRSTSRRWFSTFWWVFFTAASHLTRFSSSENASIASAYAFASAAARRGSFERTDIVMIRELRWSSSCESASVATMSSSETVEEGWAVLYCCWIISTILSERQSEIRVLNISA